MKSTSLLGGRSLRPTMVRLLALVVVLGSLFAGVGDVQAQGNLTVEIIAGYNLVVDSNVASPSTYAPRVATVIGKFCNTGGTDLTNVHAYIGDYDAVGTSTPGTYPVYDSDSLTTYPYLNGTGDYFFRHVGSTDDASRYIGTIPAGECSYQYWTFEYPACENDSSGNWEEPPCTSGDPLWGPSVKPDDDFSLDFDVWGVVGTGTPVAQTWTMTMRNEISAVANKIRPNPDGRWFNTEDDVVEVGDVVTTNGILYTLGNINQGFDNDGDYAPDYNAWLQPLSQPDFDPTCFRLISTSGVLTIDRSGGNPPLILPFDENLYFTNLPPDNTGVRGEVFYKFLALSGPCTMGITPYQEVASGFDNEKFNGDYGTGIQPVSSLAPLVTIEKSGSPSSVPAGDTSASNVLYTIPFANGGERPAGLTLSSGGVDMPLVIHDTVPEGMLYLSGSAASGNTNPTGCSSNCFTIRYSIDGGTTWSLSDPGDTLSTSGNPVMLEWRLNNPLPADATGAVTFQARVPSTYVGTPFIENTACIGLGDADPFACDDELTLVEGNNSLGDRVWKDDGDPSGTAADGVQDAGETGINGVTVSLYWDKNGDGALDDGDVPLDSATTTGDGGYGFSGLPDGNYLVVVDSDAAAIPTGYTNTTADFFAVALDPTSESATAVAALWADFGFGPALTLEKTLTSADPAYEGDLVTFDLALTNNLPGGPSDENGFCTYEFWATTGTTAGTPKEFTNYLYAFDNFGLGEPDSYYASGGFDIGSNRWIQGSGFNPGSSGGTIIKVEVVFPYYVDPVVPDDTASATLYQGAAELGTGDFTNDELNAHVGLANAGDLVWNMTTDVTPPGGSWTWDDFALLSMRLNPVKTGQGDSSIIYLDAMIFRITTNQTCGGRDSIIDPLPLVDTYDAAQLEFVSADITPDSVTTGGTAPYANTGTLSWDNVGPLAAGQTRTIEVTFRALEPPNNQPATTTNYADVTEAKFGNGRDVNDAHGEDDVTINPTGSIGDTIWNDNGAGNNSGNGVQDGDEYGIAGVTVWLYTDPNGDGDPADGTLIDTQVTGSNGDYLFEGVQDGDYVVVVDTVSLPGSTFTQTGDPDATLDSQTAVNISGANDVDWADFGYQVPNTIYGNVWHDWDGEADQDTGDDGIPGVTVRLYDCGVDGICGNGDDQVVGSPATTNADGDYVFSDLGDGTYYVVVDNNASPLGTDWQNTIDPESAPGNHESDPIAVSGGNVYGSYDFGYYQTGSYELSGKVYADWNSSEDWETGEPGFVGTTVTLYSETGAVIATTTTDAGGNYSFTNLPDGDYTIVVDEDDLPAQYTQTEDPDSTRDGRTTVTISGSSQSGLDFGYVPDGYGSIGDTVWRDMNADGEQAGSNETGVDDITVWLYVDYGDGNGYQQVMQTTTADGGQYLFDNLPPGDYRVVVDTADGDLPTDAYGNPYLLSTASSFDVTLDVGGAYLDADFGFYPGGAIGDRVWQDTNGNGNQDEDEPGISGVTVRLYTWTDVNENGYYDAGDTLVDTGQTDTTDSDGLYLFDGLPADDYVVMVESGIPSGFNQSGDPDWLEPCTGTGLCDSASGVNLYVGQIDLSRDFGYQPPGVIGDYVWFDNDADGVQDDGEQGIGYVTVYLDKWNGSSWVLDATTETDSDGYYSFGNLGAGTYQVRVGTNTLPAGVTDTYDRDGGTSSPDSIVTDIVVDSSGNVTSINSIPCTGCNLEMDFGYRYAGAYDISGYTFFDADDNGGTYIYGTDTPYGEIPVYLWKGGVLIATTTTDANGYYEFLDLPNGTDYVVSVDRNSPPLVGMTQNTPTPEPYREVTINNADVTHQDFGYYADMDMGDLPDTYQVTLLQDSGARHIIPDTGAVYLGATPGDAEANGQESVDASGDGADEDGVVPTPSVNWVTGADGGSIDVTVNGCSGTCYLSAWIDWGGDNSLYETGDLILLDEPVTNGTQTITFDVPTGTDLGQVFFSRFRLYEESTGGMAQPTGLAYNGEVEDHPLDPPNPTAVELAGFWAIAQKGTILLTWETATELDNLGFNLYRAESIDGVHTRLNPELIPSKVPGSPVGAVYDLLDAGVQPDTDYFYWLEALDIYGQTTLYGPVSARLSPGIRVFLPLMVK